MNTNIFIPLSLGEAPGDPELGGWRSLPKSLFHIPAPLTLPSTTMSIDQAVAVVGFTVQYLNLSRAIAALVIQLAQSPYSLGKGGGQFS